MIQENYWTGEMLREVHARKLQENICTVESQNIVVIL